MADPVLDLDGPHGRIIGSGPARYMQIIDGTRCYFNVHKEHLPELDTPFQPNAVAVSDDKPKRKRRKKADPVVAPEAEIPSREPTFVEPEI